MDLGLAGRTALVMGASAGLGLAVAERLAAEGARVAMVSRSRERIEAAAASVVGESRGFVADTTDQDRLGPLVEQVARELAPVEILVCNTGGPPGGGTLEHDLYEWRAAYDSLVLAPRILCEAALPAMRKGGWGRIVNLASTSVLEPIPGLTLSTIHRMGATGFLLALAREIAADGVTANTIATGRFATDRLAELYGSLERAREAARQELPVGRLGDPAELGALVTYLCSTHAAFVTGTVIPIDGGMTRGG